MNTRKGFTLVELLVVIAILAILATVSVVGYTSFITRAEVSNAQTEAHQIATVIESSLVGVEYAIVNDDAENTIYAYETTSGVVFADELPDTIDEDDKHVDLTDDLAQYLDSLTLSGTDLHYEYSDDVTVDVLTGEKQ